MTALGAEARRAQIETLRARLSVLGGAAMAHARAVRPDGEAYPRRPRIEPVVDTHARAAELGFAAEEGPGGTAFVRRVSVNLASFLDRAGPVAALDPSRLLELGCRLPTVGAPARLADDDVAVVDIETLGLRGSGVLAFLVGLGVPRAGRLEVEQFLLADPDGETALLAALMRTLGPRRLIVTYNGRCFDVPVLLARCVINRLDSAPLDRPLHADLLSPVRRLFRDRLVACTLRRAEVGLLRFDRDGDVPGCEAPARYRAWLRGGSAAVLRGVVAHNELDLCTTMVLGSRLAAHLDGQLVEPVHPADRYNLGRYLGEANHLRDALEGGEEPWSRRAGHRLALQLSRRSPSGRVEAAEIWRRLWEGRVTDLRAARALAVSLERSGELAAALDVCRQVHSLVGRDPFTAVHHHAARDLWTPDWQKRLDRLERRLAKRPGRGRLEWAAWMNPPRMPAQG